MKIFFNKSMSFLSLHWQSAQLQL